MKYGICWENYIISSFFAETLSALRILGRLIDVYSKLKLRLINEVIARNSEISVIMNGMLIAIKIISNFDAEKIKIASY